MRMDAEGDEAGRADDYGATCDGEMYDEWWELNDDRAFWRRRFLILCGGVAALAVCAWLLPSPRQPSKRESAAMSASMAALARRQALPSAAKGPPWGASAMPAVYPTASASHASSASSANGVKKPKPRKKPTTAYHPRPVATPSAAKPGGCAPADIVLSLFTSQPSYRRGAHPRFSVYAVSTAATACTLSYGAGSVQLVVTRHGHVVWDSATCRPASAQAVRFTLGVPQVLTMAWDPRATRPAGCAGSLPSGIGGTFEAVAVSHGQSSPVRAFRLAS